MQPSVPRRRNLVVSGLKHTPRVHSDFVALSPGYPQWAETNRHFSPLLARIEDRIDPANDTPIKTNSSPAQDDWAAENSVVTAGVPASQRVFRSCEIAQVGYKVRASHVMEQRRMGRDGAEARDGGGDGQSAISPCDLVAGFELQGRRRCVPRRRWEWMTDATDVSDPRPI